MKAAEALPGIIGGIISWILNRTKDVVGWVSQNLWALVVGIGGLIYTYMGTQGPGTCRDLWLLEDNYITNHNIFTQSNIELLRFQSYSTL